MDVSPFKARRSPGVELGSREADLGEEGEKLSAAAAAGAARTTGPRTPKGVQTRARLVDAAMQVFAENSLLDARISDIAQRAGLSYGAFYHYFESKEELFREVATTAVERLGALVNNLILDDSPSAPLAERLRVGIRSHFETYSDEVRILAEIERVARYDDDINAIRIEHYEQYHAQMADSVRQLQRRGVADPALDPAIAADALGAMIWRFSELWLSFGFVKYELDDAVEQMTRIFLNALGARQEGRRRRLRPLAASDRPGRRDRSG